MVVAVAVVANSVGLVPGETELPRNTVRALHVPMSRSQLPSVKYVYAVDYKSMIGGYRTLLVMNSVNPLLIPLRYLSHV